MLECTDLETDQFLAGLQEIQRRAVTWGEGPLLVLAGPGAGKTRVLACRIARILERSRGQNFRVLGLTFTNKAADEMRERVRQLAPDADRRLFLGTFHSFCADVLRQHGGHLGIKPDFRIYSLPEDRQYILNEAVLQAMRTTPGVRSSDNALLPVIDRLQSNLISPEEAPRHVRDEDLKERITAVYSAYEEQLKLSNGLDFNGLIYYACCLFRQSGSFPKLYQTVYRYWCIDEFQDTNAAQYALLKTMAGDIFRNIFAVADDDQIIYQWNGASHQRIEELIHDFGADVLQLPTNYRCPPEVVDIANNLIRHNLLRTPDKLPLQAAKPRGLEGSDVVRVLTFRTGEDEAAGVADDIAQRHSNHLSNVVVLARNRSLLDLVKHELTSLGLDAVIAQRRDSFQSAPFIWMYACLRQSVGRGDARNIETLVGAFGRVMGIDTPVADLVANAKARHGDYLREWVETIRSVAPSPEALAAVEEVSKRLVQGSDFTSFIAFATTWFDELTAGDDNASATDGFSGFQDDRRAWSELYREVKASIGRHPTLEVFLHELDLRSKEPPPSPSTATLMTIHAAKGKEFDHVYLVGLAEDILPSYQSKKGGEHNLEMEEERRNCFVAITRTSRTLTLTYARQYGRWPKQPSRFLFEMGLDHG